MMVNLEPYPADKDSGVEWLGKIPAHWKLLRGKFLFDIIDFRSTDGEEDLLTVSSSRGVVLRSSATVTMFKAESYVGHKLCWPGDLVINSLWAWAGGLGVSRYHGIVSSAYGVYRLHRSYRMYTNYMHQLVRSIPFRFELHTRSRGIWISRLQLADKEFLDIPFPIPSEEEQTAIARYLDHIGRSINHYIQAKQKLITLLEEQKQAIVQEAVTGQINVRTRKPYSAYKDSGVEWLRAVPEHWEIGRLKSFVANATNQNSERWEGERYLTLENVESWTGKIKDSNLDAPPDSQLKCFQPGDILFGKLRPYLAKVARPNVGGLCVGEFLVLRTRHVSAHLDYLEYLLRSKLVIDAINSSTFGAKMPRADWSFIGCMAVAWPNSSEQTAIAHYLDAASSKIDTAITRAQRQIELLREYRERLICNVVTGKLDIRKAAARLPQDSDTPVVSDCPDNLTGSEKPLGDSAS